MKLEDYWLIGKIGSLIASLIIISGLTLAVYYIVLSEHSKTSSEVCSIVNNTLSGTCHDKFLEETFVSPDETCFKCYCYDNKLYVNKPEFRNIKI